MSLTTASKRIKRKNMSILSFLYLPLSPLTIQLCGLSRQSTSIKDGTNYKLQVQWWTSLGRRMSSISFNYKLQVQRWRSHGRGMSRLGQTTWRVCDLSQSRTHWEVDEGLGPTYWLHHQSLHYYYSY